MGTFKHRLCILLALALLCACLPLNATAADRGAAENPATGAAESDYTTDIESAAAILREGMVNFEEKIMIYFKSAATDTEGSDYFDDIYAAAVRHTDDPKMGDYLRWRTSGYAYSTSSHSDGTWTYYEFAVQPFYNTTAEQEAAVDEAVNALLYETLKIQDSMTDYRKLKLIYDWICAHVDYDYRTHDPNDYLQYTTYGALIDRTSVCEGYATLLYRLTQEVGLDGRLISGPTDVLTGRCSHGWNIINLDGKYYNLDATWDAGNYGDYDYFLKGSNDFPDHQPDSEFDTEDFRAEYPMSGTDYEPTDQDLVEIPVYPEPEAGPISGSCNDSIHWTLSEEGVLTIYGVGHMPGYANHSAPWASHAQSIKKVVVLDAIRSISAGAFEGCTNLESVSLPDSLVSIGIYSFSGCTALEKIEIPEHVYYLMTHAFDGCTALTEVTFGSRVWEIEDYAFRGCTALKEITIPESLNRLYNRIFESCDSLRKITFEGNAPRFSDNTFGGLSATCYYQATNQTWPEVITKTYGGDITWEPIGGSQDSDPYLDMGACGDNMIWKVYETGLLKITGGGRMYDYSMSYGGWDAYKDIATKLVIEEGVEDIGEAAFWGMIGLKEVELPSTLKIINRSAFNRCSGLTGVVIPEGVTEIGTSAFMRCTSLSEVSISATVETIGPGAFSMCTSLTDLQVAPDNRHFSMSDGVLFNLDQTALVAYLKKNDRSYSVPEGVTSIGEGAFEYVESLEILELPGSITEIGPDAFAGSSIDTVRFAGNGPSIGRDAFWNTRPTCYYPAGNSTWTDFYLTQHYGGYITWKPYVLEEEPGPVTWPLSGACGSYGDNVIWTLTEDGTMTISGEGSMEDYMSDMPEWDPYRDHIQRVVVEYGVTSIGSNSFQNCTKLTSVELPEDLRFISQQAFWGCSSLPSVEIPNTISIISVTAFGNCSGLTAIHVESGATAYHDVDGVLFRFQSELVTMPGGYQGSYTIPEGVTEISTGAFEGCVDLNRLTIPASVEQIGEEAFRHATGIQEIHFTGDAPEFFMDAFAGISPTCYYPADNSTWTPGIMQYYGGSPIWKPASAEESTVTPGDTDGSGALDVADAVHLLFHALFGNSYAVNQDCDFDGSGTVDANDAIYLLFHILFGAASYPLN